MKPNTYASRHLDQTLLVYGRVTDPQVKRVEITADTGQIIRATVTEGGFVMLAPAAQHVTELRVLGGHGQVLERHDTDTLTLAVP